jgi:hypothetical protein
VLEVPVLEVPKVLEVLVLEVPGVLVLGVGAGSAGSAVDALRAE